MRSNDSPEAEDKFQDALAEFINDRYGNGMLTSYYIVAEFIDKDGDPCWITKSADKQSLSTTVGLIEWARLDIRLQSEIYLNRLYDQEDEED